MVIITINIIIIEMLVTYFYYVPVWQRKKSVWSSDHDPVIHSVQMMLLLLLLLKMMHLPVGLVLSRVFYRTVVATHSNSRIQ